MGRHQLWGNNGMGMPSAIDSTQQSSPAAASSSSNTTANHEDTTSKNEVPSGPKDGVAAAITIEAKAKAIDAKAKEVNTKAGAKEIAAAASSSSLVQDFKEQFLPEPLPSSSAQDDDDEFRPVQVGAFHINRRPCGASNNDALEDANSPAAPASELHGNEDNSNGNEPAASDKFEPVAVVVTPQEVEESVRNQIMAEAPKAEVVDVPEHLLDHHQQKQQQEQQQQQQDQHKKSRLFWKWTTFACVAVAAILVAIIIAVSQDKDNVKESNNLRSSTTSSPTISLMSPTISPTNTSDDDDDDDEHSHVYVISTKIKNFCGHEIHTAQKCGGHLASITTPQEKSIVDGLKDLAIRIADDNNETSWDEPIVGVWIGGQQSLGSQNNTGVLEEDVVWSWSDYSTWFDGTSSGDNDLQPSTSSSSSYWAEGEPNNDIEVYLNRSMGEHYVMLSRDGSYIDESGCFGKTAPRGPGIYILPKDYDDFDKYPDCTPGSFLTAEQVPVPPRPPAEWVYVLKQKYQYVCGRNDSDHFVDSPANCGGYLASITNIREKAIIDHLKDIALQQAKKDGQPNVTGVWIGGMQSFESRNNDHGPEEDVNATTWLWHDGSPWFDHDGKYWEDGQPDNTIHHLTSPERQRGEHFVMLNANGKYEDVLDCAMARGPIIPSIFMLPADYADRSKYIDCQQGDFTKVIPVPPRRNHNH